MTVRSGSVHLAPHNVVCEAAGTAAAGISQLGNDANYE